MSFVKPVIHWVRAWLGPGSSQFEFESVTRKANKPRLIRRSMSWPLIHNSEVWCGVEAGFCFVIFCSVFFFCFFRTFLVLFPFTPFLNLLNNFSSCNFLNSCRKAESERLEPKSYRVSPLPKRVLSIEFKPNQWLQYFSQK